MDGDLLQAIRPTETEKPGSDEALPNEWALEGSVELVAHPAGS